MFQRTRKISIGECPVCDQIILELAKAHRIVWIMFSKTLKSFLLVAGTCPGYSA